MEQIKLFKCTKWTRQGTSRVCYDCSLDVPFAQARLTTATCIKFLHQLNCLSNFPGDAHCMHGRFERIEQSKRKTLKPARLPF